MFPSKVYKSKKELDLVGKSLKIALGIDQMMRLKEAYELIYTKKLPISNVVIFKNGLFLNEHILHKDSYVLIAEENNFQVLVINSFSNTI